MRLVDANQLLDSPISPFESGLIRHSDGRAHVAARTHTIACKAAMVGHKVMTARPPTQDARCSQNEEIFIG
jgi:hypothetical protein